MKLIVNETFQFVKYLNKIVQKFELDPDINSLDLIKDSCSFWHFMTHVCRKQQNLVSWESLFIFITSCYSKQRSTTNFLLLFVVNFKSFAWATNATIVVVVVVVIDSTDLLKWNAEAHNVAVIVWATLLLACAKCNIPAMKSRTTNGNNKSNCNINKSRITCTAKAT